MILILKIMILILKIMILILKIMILILKIMILILKIMILILKIMILILKIMILILKIMILILKSKSCPSLSISMSSCLPFGCSRLATNWAETAYILEFPAKFLCSQKRHTETRLKFIREHNDKHGSFWENDPFKSSCLDKFPRTMSGEKIQRYSQQKKIKLRVVIRQ